MIWTLPSCSAQGDGQWHGMPGPPFTIITVVVAGHRYSAPLSLSDPHVLAAVRAACPGMASDHEAAASGWLTRT